MSTWKARRHSPTWRAVADDVDVGLGLHDELLARPDGVADHSDVGAANILGDSEVHDRGRCVRGGNQDELLEFHTSVEDRAVAPTKPPAMLTYFMRLRPQRSTMAVPRACASVSVNHGSCEML